MEKEVIEVESHSVSCDGGPLGHPMIYLEMGNNTEITCPYCNRLFILKHSSKKS